MPDKFTREELEQMFDEIMNEPSDGQSIPNLSPEARKAVGEALDEIARIMGFDKKRSQPNETTFATPTLTDAEIELAQLTDVVAGEQCDDWFADPPENCDFCHVELLKRRYFVDGKLKGSVGWANMCAECFFQCGEGVGWGAGQAYLQWRLGEWLLVGGFPPE